MFCGSELVTYHLNIIFFFLFAFSRALPMAYVGSQTRKLAGAGAASLHQSHSNAGSKPHWILNPLSKARDRTRNLIVLVGFISAETGWELPLFPLECSQHLLLVGRSPSVSPTGRWGGGGEDLLTRDHV